MYRLLRGTVQVVGYEPDGDSIRFRADNLQHWSRVGNVVPNNRGDVQLRLEGIDTLETHVRRIHHQPLDLALPARDRLLRLLGITRVQYNPPPQELRVASANDAKRATVLASGEANRRPISFLFKGTQFRAVQDGALFAPSVAQLRSSVNAKLLKEGQAYPLFYRTLDPGVRDDFTNLAIDAYNSNRDNLWDFDWSPEFAANALSDLEDFFAILPKLFRRLVRWFRNGASSTSGFVNGLRNGDAGENDRLHLTSSPNVTLRLADILEQRGNRKTIKMLHEPEEVIFH